MTLRFICELYLSFIPLEPYFVCKNSLNVNYRHLNNVTNRIMLYNKVFLFELFNLPCAVSAEFVMRAFKSCKLCACKNGISYIYS
jgi:hypothetical protein